ncbi:hypothetical protein BBJ29_003271 [Phytophthora kernoviae]|uniref:VPS9 domain-containing protein n=1 Tax=Phytophthora kernoviae TaxID=325452 RepID=A0A3F2RYP7_9STRA|nr:hypothetical protein BBJ29_003271 [Phytophthora kernoviae]RLN66893.1 hypothetical protein BBP00_00001930 [Phytophthora kernoviae]
MRRKRRRAPTIELQSTNQPENEPLCTASDQEDDEEDDDGADALIAAFGAENNPQEQEQEQEQDPNKRLGRKKTLAHTTSASMLRVCKCGRVSRASSVGEEIREDFDPHSASREYLDLHIRYAVVVRVVRVEPVNGRTVFVIRVKDAETQKKWEMKKSLKEMMFFYAQIQQISMVDAPRRVVFDSFLRQTAALVAPAPLGPRRRKAVLLLQEFVGVHRHCDVFDRGGCTCFFLKNQVNASQLVDDIFAAPSHKVPRSCEAFVTVLTRMSLNDKHMCMPDRKARTLLNTVSRKMGEIKHTMLEDEALLTQLAVARSERTEPDYDEFLDEVKHAVGGFVQKRVLVPLEDHVHEALYTITDWDDERVLQDKVKALQTKSQSFFGVPPHVAAGSSSDWEDARRELRRVNEYALPLDKLKCLARAAGAIFQTCGSSRSSSSVGTAFSLTSVEELDMVLRPSLTTDEFISVNLFVLVMSNLSQLLITREFLRVMCDAQDITGELGYYLTTFEVAVDLLIKHADPQQPMLP